MQNLFGSGFLYGVPTADATGAAIANPTPVQFGVLQDISIDFSFDNKQLHGQNQFAVAVGRGKGKISCKAKAAQVNGALFNSLFFGGTNSAGILSANNDLVGVAIPATPFTITLSTTNTLTTRQIPNSGTFYRDLGVRNASGVPMTRVASAPTTGQYTVSNVGVYVFAAADVGLQVFINYEYTATSTVAQNQIVVNQAMGYAPTFTTVLNQPYAGKTLHVRLYQCITSKLSMASKNDEFTIPEFDFDAFQDASGNVLAYGLSE
jgi:hypothetical protein